MCLLMENPKHFQNLYRICFHFDSAIMLSSLLKVIVVSLCVLLGLVVYAAYSLCDPYYSGKISHIDQVRNMTEIIAERGKPERGSWHRGYLNLAYFNYTLSKQSTTILCKWGCTPMEEEEGCKVAIFIQKGKYTLF